MSKQSVVGNGDKYAWGRGRLNRMDLSCFISTPPLKPPHSLLRVNGGYFFSVNRDAISLFAISHVFDGEITFC